MNWLSGAPAYLGKVFLAAALLAGTFAFKPQTQASLTTYVPQAGTPVVIPNFVDPNAGCNWVGVGGQVFKSGGQPDTGLVVRVSGTLEGKPINVSTISGSSLQFGPGGFDLALGTHPVASDSLRLQLFDLAGTPKSGEVIVPLLNSCSQNLTVINLVKKTFSELIYLPLVSR